MLIGAVAAVVFVVSDAADVPSLLVAGRMAASGSVVLTMLAVWLADGMHHAGGGGRR